MYHSDCSTQFIGLSELNDTSLTDILILTKNDKQATYLNEVIYHYKWSGKIFTLKKWIVESYNFLVYFYKLEKKFLEEYAIECLWQKAIKKSQDNVLNIDEMAKLCIETNNIFEEWIFLKKSINTYKGTFHYNFFVWLKNYSVILSELNCDDINSCYKKVIEAIHYKLIQLPSKVMLFGFIEISPRMLDLIKSLKKYNVQVFSIFNDRKNDGNFAFKMQCTSRVNEWYSSIEWYINNSTFTKKRFSIVLPEFYENDDLLIRRVESKFKAFGINHLVDRSLRSFPIINAAICWLRAIDNWIPNNNCKIKILGNALIQGYCVADEEEFNGRIQADIRFRQTGKTILNSNSTAEILECVPILKQCILHAIHIWHESKNESNWSSKITRILKIIGFSWNPLHFKNKMLEELQIVLNMHDHILLLQKNTISSSEAIDLLEFLSKKKLVDLSCDDTQKRNIDILKLEDVYDIHWDGAWLIGLTDCDFPSVANQNKLFPNQFLRQSNMMISTPEGQYEFSSKMIKNLCNLSKEVIASYSNENSFKPRPSFFVKDWPNFTVNDKRTSNLFKENSSSIKIPERILIKKKKLTQPTIVGGINLLKLQIENPLWAFARYQLGIKKLEEYEEKTIFYWKNNFLLESIRSFWSNLSSQVCLKELKISGHLDKYIENNILEIFDIFCSKNLHGKYQDLLQYELGNIFILIKKYIELELNRSPFKVHKVNFFFKWKYKNLIIFEKIDRLDVIENGDIAVIKYTVSNIRDSNKSDQLLHKLYLLFCTNVIKQQQLHVNKRVILMHININNTSIVSYLPQINKCNNQENVNFDSSIQSLECVVEDYLSRNINNLLSSYKDMSQCDVLPFLRIVQDVANNLEFY